MTFLVALAMTVTAGVALSPRSDAAVPYPDAQRIDGGDPVSVAVAVSQELFPNGGAEAVVLARKDLFPDSLSATGFASIAKAPILFTSTASLDAATKAEIERVLPSGRVYIMGGFSAVSQQVEDQIEAMGYAVSRFRGADRYQTAALTGRAILFASTVKTVVVARGHGEPDATQGWVDAVACGAWAADRGYPILLTDPRAPGLNEQTRNVLESEDIVTVHICGGTAAVPQAHEDQLKTVVTNVFRHRGPDRVETALAAARNLWGVRDAKGREVILVPGFGDRFAYGIAASQLSAKRDAPMLLVDATTPQTCLSSDNGFQTLCYLSDASGALKGVTVIGSTSIVSDDVLGAAAEAARLTRDLNPPGRVEDLAGDDFAGDDGTKVSLEFTAVTDPEGAEVSYDVYYREPPAEPEPSEEPSEGASEEPTEEPSPSETPTEEPSPSETPTEEPSASEEPSEEPAPEQPPLTKENGTLAQDVELTIEDFDGTKVATLVVTLCGREAPKDEETGEPTGEPAVSTCQDKEYEFIVIARDSGGNEAEASDVVTAAPVDDVPAVPAEAPTAEPASGGFTTVRWTAAPEADAAGYVIERADYDPGDPLIGLLAGCGDYAEVGRVTGRATISFLDNGTSPDSRYCYQYRIFDTTGNETEPSPALEDYTA